MPGHRHSPLGDINRIRQDLRDRYADGFPILKELLQNADDAGATVPGDTARFLVVALANDGLPGADHPLLRNAGLVVLNDGGFTLDDAVSITSIGMSNKTGQTGSAGKLGLGLKSVYHWTEAFFYFSSASFDGNSGRVSPYDLLNPWWSNESNDGRHGDWEKTWQQTRGVNCRASEKLAQSLLGTERWFGLWIPLRSKEHLRDEKGEVQPIENRFPPLDLDDLLGQDWVYRLAETLPLLRRLKTVRV